MDSTEINMKIKDHVTMRLADGTAFEHRVPPVCDEQLWNVHVESRRQDLSLRNRAELWCRMSDN